MLLNLTFYILKLFWTDITIFINMFTCKQTAMMFFNEKGQQKIKAHWRDNKGFIYLHHNTQTDSVH